MAQVLPIIALTPIIDEILQLMKSRSKRKRETDLVAVAMFDLPGSTKIKLTEGHSKGTQLALEHNLICEKIAKEFGGSVIKHMGDGVFIKFENPVKACEAALNIKKATIEDGRFVTKGGLTLGVVESIEISGIKDLLGSTIDRCARIVSMAIPNQILIDQTLFTATESFLRDFKDVIISEPLTTKAKGIGDIIVYELSIGTFGFTGFGLLYLKIIEEGRMPLNEKMAFLSSTKEEIIELGIGLSSFSDNYFRQRPSEFKDKIISLLKKGVIIKCIILNPENDIAKIYVKDNKEPEYLKRMEESLTKLLEIKKEFQKGGLNNFKIFMHEKIPRFHASCIDIDKPWGSISITNYLPEILRSKNPVIQFSKYSNPELFNIYSSVIKNMLKNSSEIEPKST